MDKNPTQGEVGFLSKIIIYFFIFFKGTIILQIKNAPSNMYINFVIVNPFFLF
jgi:hypothetical protein